MYINWVKPSNFRRFKRKEKPENDDDDDDVISVVYGAAQPAHKKQTKIIGNFSLPSNNFWFAFIVDLPSEMDSVSDNALNAMSPSMISQIGKADTLRDEIDSTLSMWHCTVVTLLSIRLPQLFDK